jgi:diaminohydroxyphosphoribosylaminopyrimidine deaminase/5-amino-6-(5-phosphoribosylamino)uracil reductase
MVGCVIVKDGRVIGEGFHARYGGPHAEPTALAACTESPAGATAYVTLEPCDRYGRTPPCTEALLAARVARVVCASADPTQSGLARLRAAGVDVELLDPGHELARAARRQNAAFRTWTALGRPHVRLKLAATLDGRTATRTGDSRWISGAESRRLVHRWRAESGAVLVGIGTVLADDPALTARDVEPAVRRQPVRAVLDRHARLPLDSRLTRSAEDAPVVAFVSRDAPAARRTALERRGVETAEAASPADALRELGRRQVTSVLLEGGATVAGALVGAGLVDRLALFVAPVLLGDPAAPGIVGPTGALVTSMQDARRTGELESVAVGGDILVDAWLREPA